MLSRSFFLLTLIVAIVYCISILRKAYSRLHKTMEKAGRANQLEPAFLANMSYEIRTPLNAIVGLSNMLPHAENREEMSEYVELIEANTDLLLQLIDDTLDLSKIEAGTFDFYPALTDVNQMSEEIEQSMQLHPRHNNVTLTFAEELSQCTSYADRNRLIQPSANFAVNAIRFIEAGAIRMGYYLLDPETIYFYMSDTGCGMFSERCIHVFERFVKYNSSVQGIGLGLSVCYTIVDHLGGKVGAEPKENKGSTFWFILPYRQN